MSKKTIAFLLGDIRDVYSNTVSKGAIKAAKEQDCNLLIVPGRYFHAGENLLLGEYEYQYQTLFSYFRENNVDIIVLASGCVGFVSGAEGRNSLDKFIEQIGDIPLLTISGDSKNLPNVRYDNVSGIKEGISYMINKQNCRKIAMVGGTQDNLDSKERVNAYREALAEAGLPVDEDLIIYGDFTERTAKGIEELFKKHPEIDGAVFANDRMAIGGYDAMRNLGRVVGRDVCFLGFDNIEKDNYVDPPLSSVDADAIGLGYTAVIEALKYAETHEVVDRVIPSRFIIRNSIVRSDTREIIEQALGYKIDDDTDFEVLAEDSFRYVYNPSDNNEEGKKALYECYRRFLYDLAAVVFSDNMLSARIEILRYSFAQMFEEDVKGDLDVGRLIVVLEAMEQNMLLSNPSEAKNEAMVRMTSYAYKYISGVISLRESNKAYRMKKIQHEIFRISADLVGFHNISDQTYGSVLSNFERFGIHHCYLFLFENRRKNLIDDEFTPDRNLYLKAALKDGEVRTPSKLDQSYNLQEVFDFAFRDAEGAGHLIMLNLYIRQYIYGFILCDIPYEIFNIYESFNYQVSNAVRIIRLLLENDETGKQLKQSLELLTKNNIRLDGISKTDELTGILNRRGFMQEAERMLSSGPRRASDPDEKYIMVGYADADGLKYVNDTYGHEEGDRLIIRCAETLTKALDGRGIVGRLGGDEFAILRYASGEEDKESLIKSVEGIVDEYNAGSDKPYPFSISFGAFIFDYKEGMEISKLLEFADKEMYHIKAAHHKKRGEKPE